MRTRNKNIIEAIIAVGVPVLIVLYLLLFHTNLIIISNPDSNIYIEHLNWTDVTRINETTDRVALSGDVTYRYKDSSLYSSSSKDEPLPDDLPVRILVLAGVPNSRDREVTSSENITLQYRQPYHFEYTFDLKAGKSYDVQVEAHWKRYFATPHPYYGEWRWERFGGLATEIDLTHGEMPPQHDLSEEDRGYAIAIALKDERVRAEIRNKEYEIGDVSKAHIEIAGPEENFSGEVPVVPIKIGNVTLMVFVDIEQGEVINVGHQWEKSLLTPSPASEE
ncbi:MAG: hypothetical protein JW878_03580 [Methanomicrobia archaeon]|nr:hypothetical protein [Methanomicrobia archaeon]